MLPIVPRYLFQEALRTFLSSLGGLCLFIVPPAALSALHKLGGVGPEVLIGFLPLIAAQLLPHLVPIAFLLGITRVGSGLVARREWLALEMSGRHPVRTFLPMALVAVGLCALSAWSLHLVVPPLRLAQVEYRYEAAVEAAQRGLVGRTSVSLGGFAVVGQALDGDRILDAVVRLESEDEAEDQYLMVERVGIVPGEDELVLELEGVRYLHGSTVGASGRLTAKVRMDQILRARHANPSKPTYMGSTQIVERLTEGVANEKVRWRLEYEIQRRWALSATYLVYALCGLLMGLRLASESVLGPLGATIGLAGLYHVLYQHVGRELALSGAAPAWVGAWLANGVLLAGCLVAMFLRWRR